MKYLSVRATMLVSIVVLTLGICQCSDNTLAPFQPEITSVTDNFQLQATGVKNRTATLTYNWSNTGTRATVDHSTTTTAGSAKLVVLDAGGVKLYDRALVPSKNDTTATGTAGTWKVRLVLDHYSGTLNFRAQKL